jgi:signal transduction histidine kinase
MQLVDQADIKGKTDSAQTGSHLYLFANIYSKKGNYFKALEYYRKGYGYAVGSKIHSNIMENGNGIAKIFWKTNQPDSTIYYAKRVLEASKDAQYPVIKLEALGLLADVYKSQGNIDSTVKYLELTLATKDSLFNQQKVIQIQSMTFNEQLRQQDIRDAQKAYRDRIKTDILIGGLIVLLLVAFSLFRNNRNKQKAKVKIEKAYAELKNTQAQLIQSEKMASLGELTAGIAHEIQNPLNFVNNFSELNTELISEMQQELDKGNLDDAKAISNDVKKNEQKISHHGKRADVIVKGMLQHSRASTGKKELTDINKLAHEYLRLSYHGFRAKDKSFNATIETDFDPAVGKLNVVPQDIGRVILNLINNAFYAVGERQNVEGIRYQPTVTVRTKKLNDKVEIKVNDNGNGIPQKILNKIFEPFFTTKPTGQGTGLGLSLSYDIIKAHGGEVEVETEEGKGAEFIIQLPIDNKMP